MYISSLHLNGFRNLKPAIFAPSKGCNVILGLNAQGKTNLLEAIYYCAFAKSHRQKNDEGLIGFNAPFASVKCYFWRSELHHNINVYLTGKQKKIVVDGTAIKKRGELIGQMYVVMFCPEDLNIVKGSPNERRRFIDRSLSQLYPKYFEALSKYYIALKNRNADLKDGGKAIDAWDEQLARYGSVINQFRVKYVDEIGRLAAGVHRFMVMREKLSLSHNISEALLKQDTYIDALKKARDKDLRFGITGIGPHKEDIDIQLLDMPARLYASQGQQRTIALSLKLAELKFITDKIGESPILLLDDVMSELDKTRQSRLMSQIEGIQSFITTTHMELAHSGDIYTMRKGEIT